MYYYLWFLYTATPPYIPTQSGPDDSSHFEQIKPQHGMSHFSSYKSSHNQYGCNQSLHFVGFTHSKFPVTADHPLPVTTVKSVCVCVCVCVLCALCAYVCFVFICLCCVCVCVCVCACECIQ